MSGAGCSVDAVIEADADASSSSSDAVDPPSNGAPGDDDGVGDTSGVPATSSSPPPADASDDGDEATGDDDDGGTTSVDDGDADDRSSSSDDAPGGTTTTTDGGDEDVGSTSDAEDDDGASSDDGGPSPLFYEESFAGDVGDPWPAPWSEVGTAVIDAALTGTAARLRGTSTQVARMGLDSDDAIDIDATVVVAFQNFAQQGIGFYARQNGGALQQTNPHGQGYCMYLEGQGTPSIGIWRETNGVEEPLTLLDNPLPGGVAAGALVVMRLQVQQSGGVTQLRTKVWPHGSAEPAGWAVDIVDNTPALQNTAGGFAFDVYNYGGDGDAYLDDVAITEL